MKKFFGIFSLMILMAFPAMGMGAEQNLYRALLAQLNNKEAILLANNRGMKLRVVRRGDVLLLTPTNQKFSVPALVSEKGITILHITRKEYEDLQTSDIEKNIFEFLSTIP